MNSSPRAEILFWLGVTAIFFLLIYLLSPILLPFAAGGIIAYFLDPAVRWMARLKIARWLATIIVLCLFLVALIVLIALFVPLLRLQASELINQLPTLFTQASSLLNQAMQLAAKRLPAAEFQKVHAALGGSVGDLMGWAIRRAQGLLTSGLALANLLSL
ncbi:MAG: AI-2E family transporter, partial [Stellaceae bacterium]